MLVYVITYAECTMRYVEASIMWNIFIKYFANEVIEPIYGSSTNASTSV